jgi:hypothetical protein
MTEGFPGLTINQLRGYAARLTVLAREYAPVHLREGISSKADINDDEYKITIIAIGVDARAQEYGSGIRSKRSKVSKYQLGPKGKIRIAPKTKKYLAFPWQRIHPFPIYDGEAVIIRWWQPKEIRNKSVLHPGIRPANKGAGYISPAIKDVRKEINKKLSKDGKNGINMEFKKVFKSNVFIKE